MMRDVIFTFESFVSCWGDLIWMGSLEEWPHGLWSIAPPVLGARTATVILPCLLDLRERRLNKFGIWR